LKALQCYRIAKFINKEAEQQEGKQEYEVLSDLSKHSIRTVTARFRRCQGAVSPAFPGGDNAACISALMTDKMPGKAVELFGPFLRFIL
jgi:hypothetical protein